MSKRNSRTKAQRLDPTLRLTEMLEAAYIEAYVIHNPYHDRPATDGSEKVARLGALGWRVIAEGLLKRGVKLPLTEET